MTDDSHNDRRRSPSPAPRHSDRDRDDRDDPSVKGRTVWVGNLPFSATSEYLEGEFSQYGKISHLDIPRWRDTGRSRGYAFIEYVNPEDAEASVRKAHGMQIEGRTIEVEISGRPPKRGGGGGDGGYGGRRRSPPRGNGRYAPYDSRDSRGGGGGGDRYRSSYRDRSRSPPRRDYRDSRGGDNGGGRDYDRDRRDTYRRDRSPPRRDYRD